MATAKPLMNFKVLQLAVTRDFCDYAGGTYNGIQGIGLWADRKSATKCRSEAQTQSVVLVGA